jgi:flagellar motor switch protein FliG
VNITKPKFSKWRLASFVKVTDKEMSEIKRKSVPKTQKTCVKILKQLFASGSVIIGD